MDIDMIDKVIELLSDFDMRVEVEKDNQVQAETLKRLRDYLKRLKKINIELAKKGEDIVQRIEQIFENYFASKFKVATEDMEKILIEYQSELFFHNFDTASDGLVNEYSEANKFLYKGRAKPWQDNLNRKDMLHIPFNERDKIRTQRFSMPGIPCLYLGQSLYIVWEELNRPDLNNLFVSQYEVDVSKKFFDIGISVEIFKGAKEKSDLINSSEAELNKVLLTFLFTIACAVKVKETVAFRSEYIIPQLLLMAIMDKTDAFGIRYFSTKVENKSYIFVNYAIPAINTDKRVKIDNKEYDKIIVETIKLTHPINLGLYNMDLKNYGIVQSENMLRDWASINLSDDYFISYKDSIFYRIEMKMKNDFGSQFKTII